MYARIGMDALDPDRLLSVLTALNEGDFSRRLPTGLEGAASAIAETFNTLLDRLEAFASEMNRITWEVGTAGRFGGQAEVEGLSGTWKELTDNLNVMGANLTNQVRDIARVTREAAHGNPSRRVTVNARGETQELKESVNTLLDRLEALAGQLNRITREVTAGKFGGQAQIDRLRGTWKEFPTREEIERFVSGAQGEGVSCAWKEAIDNLNVMSARLTHQVRDITEVTSAVANGNASQRVTVNAQGEMLLLKESVNTLVDQANARESQHSPGR